MRAAIAWLMICLTLAGNLLAVAHAHAPLASTTIVTGEDGGATPAADDERQLPGSGTAQLCDVCGHALSNGLAPATVTRLFLPAAPQLPDFRANAAPTRAYAPPDRPPK